MKLFNCHHLIKTTKDNHKESMLVMESFICKQKIVYFAKELTFLSILQFLKLNKTHTKKLFLISTN